MNELLKQQLEEATKRRKPAPIKEPRAVGVSYNAELQRLVRQIKSDVNQYLVPLLRDLSPQYSADSAIPRPTNDAWSDTLIAAIRALLARWSSPAFRAAAEALAQQFVQGADTANASRFKRSMGIDVFGDDPNLQNYLALATEENVNLITSIPDQYLKNVQSIIMTNVQTGNRPSAIVKALQEQFGVTQRRAQFIARDQTAKVNATLVEKRQTAAGFQWFQWIDSDDSRVRERHSEIAEKVTAYGKGIYRWDNPPLSDRGTPIIPGSDFNCRCSARPVTRREVEANQAAERVRKGVKR